MIEYFNINQTAFNTTNTVNFAKIYIQSLPELVRAGDFTAITVSIVLLLLGLIIINKITNAMMKVIESALMLTIISYASYLFAMVFIARSSIQGFTVENVLILIVGILAIVSGIFEGIKTLIHRASKYNIPSEKEIERYQNKNVQSEYEPLEFNKLLKFDSIKSDNSIGKRLAYLIISEFGVFSSKTISAPNPKVGMAIFFIFLFGIIFYIFTMHTNKTKEMQYFLITLITSMIVASVLAITWSLYPPSEIFSLKFFSTDALVAVITGTSISMYMGGK